MSAINIKKRTLEEKVDYLISEFALIKVKLKEAGIAFHGIYHKTINRRLKTLFNVLAMDLNGKTSPRLDNLIEAHDGYVRHFGVICDHCTNQWKELRGGSDVHVERVNDFEGSSPSPPSFTITEEKLNFLISWADFGITVQNISDHPGILKKLDEIKKEFNWKRE